MSCADIRGQLVAYRKHELSLLQTTKVEQHLARCPACARLHTQLSLGFEAARRAPQVDRAHLVRLIARLGPYLETAQPDHWPLAYGAGGALAALAAVLVAFGLWKGFEPPAPDFGAAVVERARPQVAQVRLVPKPRRLEWLDQVANRTLVRSRPLPALRIISSPDWTGRVLGGRSDEPRVVMDQGYASFDYQGEVGQVLRVQTKDLEVELQEARAYVVREPSGLTTIGLLSGRAAVAVDGELILLAPGEQRTFGPGAAAKGRLEMPAALTSAADFVDEVRPAIATLEPVAEADAPSEVLEPRFEPLPNEHDSNSPVPTSEVAAGPEVQPPVSVSLAQQLAEAEDQARRGERGAARARYEALLDQASEPERPLVQYELARLLAADGATDRAMVLYRTLGQGENEVAIQANFALCQLQLQQPCAAASCLDRIMTDLSRPVTVRAEAAQLKARWRLSSVARCSQ
ncbi:MAG: zf-HC2 domain-containing protein [Deltaproteobacteria bacterium]|nr:zf-HC2 domain-containing protein [Deltaproteobacteria bacterium]